MTDYKGKRVLVMGLARSGLAAVRLLSKLGAEVTVSEAKPLDEIKELYEVISRVHPGKTHLSGNIGIALCDTALENDLLNDEGHYIVLEISNFQLLDIDKFRPEVAVIMNLSADHLDFMGTEDAYYRSKCRVYENMRDNDIFLWNIDDPLVNEYTSLVPVRCRRVTYSLVDSSADFYADGENVYGFGKKLFPLNCIKVVGRHNVQNVLVACAAAAALK